jgi:hypothetical protein
MITWQDVLAIAPELSTVSLATYTAILADVAVQLNADSWGVRYDLASKYLAAHLATISTWGSQGPSGTVIGESVGGVSRQYANNSPMGTDPLWDRTPYGREYRRLLRQLPSRMGFVC